MKWMSLSLWNNSPHKVLHPQEGNEFLTFIHFFLCQHTFSLSLLNHRTISITLIVVAKLGAVFWGFEEEFSISISMVDGKIPKRAATRDSIEKMAGERRTKHLHDPSIEPEVAKSKQK
ncbi:hypothetical protein K7X08_024621 [Anisodus acutangulus]|uniref:Uncharacterized protein n=1 Tax=Anisodus acutangulus TaxID=402998 RepID=A0A9Q1RG48_9SOLA|nr:hypothetical protein K7X08_024621 [Anisodus acutangulus]